MKRIAVLFLALGFFTLQAGSARADATVGESLQWLLATRSSVAIETVASTTPIPAKPGTMVTQLNIATELTKVIKGQPPQKANFVRRFQLLAIPGQDDTARPPHGTEYLLFFNETGTVTNAINLTYPSRKVGIGADANDVPLDTDFSILKTKELIMEAVDGHLKWMQDHPSAQPITTVYPTPLATPAGATDLPVPMTSPAWDVLYAGGSCQCMLRMPADANAEKASEALETQGLTTAETHIIHFEGPAHSTECTFLPYTSFRIRSAVAKEPHTVTITCTSNTDGNVMAEEIMALTFSIGETLHDRDYNFEWASDPDTKTSADGMFTRKQRLCESAAHFLRGRVPQITKIEPATPADPVMYAAWTASCMESDAWKFVLAFQLSVRKSSNEAIAAVLKPILPVSGAISSTIGEKADIIVIHKPEKTPPAQ